jgi:hypothetical protein
MNKLKDEHSKELRVKEDKLNFLKQQISESFKDNSW